MQNLNRFLKIVSMSPYKLEDEVAKQEDAKWNGPRACRHACSEDNPEKFPASASCSRECAKSRRLCGDAHKVHVHQSIQHNNVSSTTGHLLKEAAAQQICAAQQVQQRSASRIPASSVSSQHDHLRFTHRRYGCGGRQTSPDQFPAGFQGSESHRAVLS